MSDAAGPPRSPASPARVELQVELTPPIQRRWTIAIRWILALPLAFAALGIYVAAFFWLVGAWFTALITGRVSDGLQRRLCGVLRFQARLSAYVNLLSDEWPGVHFEARAGDPVVLEIDHVDLRRSAVFFRAILAIPAGILASAVSSGLYPFLLVMWVWGLVSGRAPRPLHQLAALCVRFSIRAAAFWTLMTPTQPFGGFFGDTVAPALARAASAPEPSPPPSLAVGAVRTGPPPTGTPWLVARSVPFLLIVVTVLGLVSGSTGNRWHH